MPRIKANARILGVYGGRRVSASSTSRPFKNITFILRSFTGRLCVSVIVLLFCTVSLISRIQEDRIYAQSQFDVEDLWAVRSSDGWRSSSLPSLNWNSPASVKNGYLLVRCNGGLNQQRSAICNAVLAARIMNATLVIPDLDTNAYWNDKSGFAGIYDVDHFIKSLKNDVKIVRRLPRFDMVGNKKKKLKAFQLRPPRDASPEWYQTVALQKMKEHGAIYLTPFSHRLAEEINNYEYQKLRCRVNFHALRFNKDVMKLSQLIVRRLRSEGRFMAVHLRFELDMLAFAGCFAIFTPEEQEILEKYRKQNFAEKHLVHDERRMIGKCPLTPEETPSLAGQYKMSQCTFASSNLWKSIIKKSGDIFGGERFMQPLRMIFPRLENRTSIATAEELKSVRAEGKGLLGPAVDYMVCLLADIFMPTYDGPSNFANNVMGHRLYYGFRTSIQPNRKVLAPIFKEREKGNTEEFESKVRLVMQNTPLGGPHPRIPPESFYTNPWPECFCKSTSESIKDKCAMEVTDVNDYEFIQVDESASK